MRLPLVVGLGNALEMILTGDRYKADEAQRMGLVNSVVEPDELVQGALWLESTLAHALGQIVRLRDSVRAFAEKKTAQFEGK